jgi:hypothetical protein
VYHDSYDKSICDQSTGKKETSEDGQEPKRQK